MSNDDDTKPRIVPPPSWETSTEDLSPIGFTVRSYYGAEVKHEDGETLVTTLSDGLVVHVTTLFGDVRATVRHDGKCKPYAETEKAVYPLEWANDERACWVCAMGALKKAIKR